MTNIELFVKKEDLVIYLNLKNKFMEYIILSAHTPETLTRKVQEKINEGWKPIGGHSVVETHRQNRYRGQDHMDTLIESEYAQTMIKD
jgi:hypothetical protein